MGVVLGDLAESGYDAEWDCIPASAVGAPHRRDRVWLLAYPSSANAGSGAGELEGKEPANGQSPQFLSHSSGGSRAAEAGDNHSDVAYAKSVRRDGRPTVFRREGQAGESFGAVRGESGRQGEDVAYADGSQRQGGGVSFGVHKEHSDLSRRGQNKKELADAFSFRQQGQREHANSGDKATDSKRETSHAFDGGVGGQWAVEPNVGRVANGVPARVDRLKGLGNAVVPQVVEWIGRRIMEAE